ncbi:MAG: ABC transporter substrate-binding protein [Actinomycetota bacterium]|nr:ABC transporter substrate-binding protein [Actinomycetota bacterium]
MKAARLLALACLASVAAACGGGLDEGSDAGAAGEGNPSLVVGSANFPENALLAEIYARALEARALDVSTKLNIGSREALFPALERGDVTVVPEYTGALLTYVTKGKADATDTGAQIAELESALPAGLTVLEPSDAQDQETVACTKEIAERYSLRTLEDLARVGHRITMGGPPELPRRAGFGLDGLKAVYGIEFKRFRPLDVAGPLTVSALEAGKVDCANLFSTQSAIEVNGFVALEDPKGLIESEAVVPLVTRDAATPEVTEALNAVSASLTTENLKEMVKRIEVDKDDAATVADDFLREHGLN